MIEIKELRIKTTIEPSQNNSTQNNITNTELNEMKKEIIKESVEHFSKLLKNKKER
ncbi:MAG: DUF5908 family protein [Saprospiraceae bacterium]